MFTQVEITKFKEFKEMSEETICFHATVTCTLGNGEQVEVIVKNAGHGGCDEIHWSESTTEIVERAGGKNEDVFKYLYDWTASQKKDVKRIVAESGYLKSDADVDFELFFLVVLLPKYEEGKKEAAWDKKAASLGLECVSYLQPFEVDGEVCKAHRFSKKSRPVALINEAGTHEYHCSVVWIKRQLGLSTEGDEAAESAARIQKEAAAWNKKAPTLGLGEIAYGQTFEYKGIEWAFNRFSRSKKSPVIAVRVSLDGKRQLKMSIVWAKMAAHQKGKVSA